MESVAEMTVCGIPMGGRPGLHATVMAGSIFFDRHRIVTDMKEGVFDRAEAGRLLALQDDWSVRTGNPRMVDIVASSPRAIERYLEFVCAQTDAPVMIDGSSPEVRIAGLRWAAAAGVMERVVYNSLSPESLDYEFEALADVGCRAAVILSLSSRDLSLIGRISTLEGEDGLIARARAAGVKELMIDPGVLDLPSLGVAGEAMRVIKDRFGLVAGTAAHNAVGTWGGLKEGKFGEGSYERMASVIYALNTAWGGSFLLYGPLSAAPVAFPAVAAVDACLAQVLMEDGVIVDIGHPLFRLA